MLQIQSNFVLPWQLDGAASFSYLDGRPYSRQARAALEQGGTVFIAEPASDDRRLPDQTLLDVGIGRSFDLSNGLRARLDAQILNLLNEDANDFWEGSSYSRGQLIASDWVLPRRVQLRLQLSWGS